MSDSVKKWFEMQEEKEHKDVLYTHAPNRKAYRILIDYDINLTGNGMINHLAEIPAYTVPSIQERQSLRSIDKIITTKNSRIEVSNIKVIKYSSTRKFGHWPITFNINETI